MAKVSSSFIDPAALMRIRSLEMRARIVVEGYWKGLHRSPFHGFSVEFSEYRQYVRGDDPRFIDWKVYARSDRHYIKKFEDETNLRCHLFADQSRSMSYASGEVRKVDYAGTLAATFAYYLMGQGDAVGLSTFHENEAARIPPRNRPGHLRRLMLMLEQDPQGKATDIAGMLDRIPLMVRRKGLVVIVSDFLVPMESLQTGLKNLQAAGHDVVLFQILDPAEVDFPFEKAGHFQDVESGEEFFVDPAVARSRYLERFQAHQDALKKFAGQYGMDLHVHRTDEPLELSLWEFVNRRQGAPRSRSARNR